MKLHQVDLMQSYKGTKVLSLLWQAMSANKCLEKYILLINEFVNGEITASQFESSYLKMFKNERDPLTEKAFNTLNNLFLDVDACCDDPSLRDNEDINEEKLLESAKTALAQIT